MKHMARELAYVSDLEVLPHEKVKRGCGVGADAAEQGTTVLQQLQA